MSLGLPWFLVDNLLSIAEYPSVILAGNEELTGFPAANVANGRRSGINYWSPITPNQQAYLAWNDGRSRCVDMLVLDRGHNLAGFPIQLWCSNDNATWQVVVSLTVPLVCTPSQMVDEPLGVVTEEGAFLLRFPATAAVYWRFVVPAMGVGLLPNVTGLWVGKSWYPGNISQWAFNLPSSPGGARLRMTETESEAGWSGRGLIAPQKDGQIILKLTNIWDYDLGRYHIESLYGDQAAPCWVAFDDLQSERAFLVQRPADHFGFVRERDWFFPVVTIPYREHETLRP